MFSILHSAIIHIRLLIQIICIFTFQDTSQSILARITPRVPLCGCVAVYICYVYGSVSIFRGLNRSH